MLVGIKCVLALNLSSQILNMRLQCLNSIFQNFFVILPKFNLVGIFHKVEANLLNSKC
jgi:hypothetical protein